MFLVNVISSPYYYIPFAIKPRNIGAGKLKTSYFWSLARANTLKKELSFSCLSVRTLIIGIALYLGHVGGNSPLVRLASSITMYF